MISVAIGGVLTGLIKVGQNMSVSLSTTEEQLQLDAERRAEMEAQAADTALFAGGQMLAFLIYIVVIRVVFALKKKSCRHSLDSACSNSSHLWTWLWHHTFRFVSANCNLGFWIKALPSQSSRGIQGSGRIIVNDN